MGDTKPDPDTETTKGFIAGFQRTNKEDINNCLFIARELFKLKIDIKFRGAGRKGVKSFELYGILDSLNDFTETAKIFLETGEKWRLYLKYGGKAYHCGEELSKCSSSELILMATYLFNEGKSSLTESEKALRLLKEKFPDVCTKFNPSSKVKWHPWAEFKGGSDSFFNSEGSRDYYECPICGLNFSVEVPD